MILKKRNAIACLLVITLNAANAQNIDTRKFIEVTGSAEMTIQPDEIELQVVLMECSKKSKLDDVEAAFYEVLKENDIKKESVQIESSDNYNWWYYWDYRSHEYHTKTIKVKLNNKTNFMELAKDLHVEWVRSANVSNSTNKETPRLRKEVKMQAIKAAKEKAGYLLESVGEQIGNVLSIEEMPETQQSNNYWYQPIQSYTSNSVMNNNSSQSSAIENGKEIKLRYEVKVKFEIK